MTAIIQYVTAVGNTAGQTEYTFSNVAIGTAAANRKIILCVETRKTGTGLCEIESASVDGVHAEVVFQLASAPSGTVNYAGIITANVPTGTTATVVVKFSVSVLRVGIQVYTVTGELHDADGSLDEHPSKVFDIPEGSVALGCLAVASNQTFDWGGLDQDHIDLIGGSLRVASATRAYSSTSLGQSLSITRTSGTWSSPVGVFAVWGPGGEPPESTEGDFAAELNLNSSFSGSIDVSGTTTAEFAVDQEFAGSRPAEANFAVGFSMDSTFAGTAPAMPGVGEFAAEFEITADVEGSRISTVAAEIELEVDATFTGSAPAVPSEGAFAAELGLTTNVHTQRNSAGIAEIGLSVESHFAGYHEPQSSFAVGFALDAEFAGPVTIPTGDKYYIFQTADGYYAFQTS